MATVAVNAPLTPVTVGSNGRAMATVPNVCEMPYPTPLPNTGMSALLPMGYSITVLIETFPVAILGAFFASVGDIESLATGGGVISANAGGWTKFITPGSLNVRIEGKNVYRLGDPTFNNCGMSGSPPNAATLPGIIQSPCPIP